MGSIELVVTDLDGTLWSSGRQLHPRAAAAVDDVIARGVPVIAASARARRNARHALEEHGLRLDAIFHDGALGTTVDDSRFHACALTADQITGIVATLAAFGYEPIFEADDPRAEVLLGDDPSFPMDRFGHASTWRCDLTQALPVDVFTAMVLVDLRAAATIVDALAASGAGLAWFEASPWQPDAAAIKVRPPGCSKWNATVRYCQFAGLDPGRVLAIGNDDNDVDLLRNAAVSLAPRDASTAAATAADHLVGTAGEGGWAEVLDHL